MSMRTRGFTLIEALIAITIVTVAVGGPLLAASRSYSASMDANNRMTASYLAQEGVEYVRMLRDDTYLADYQAGKGSLSRTAFYDDFLDGNNGGTNIPNTSTSIYGCEGNPYNPNTGTGSEGGDGSVACALDATMTIGVGSGKALQVCQGPNSCPALNLINNQYVLVAGGTPSSFVRSIKFYSFQSIVKVVVTVSWSYHGSARSVSLTEYLAPWQ